MGVRVGLRCISSIAEGKRCLQDISKFPFPVCLGAFREKHISSTAHQVWGFCLGLLWGNHPRSPPRPVSAPIPQRATRPWMPMSTSRTRCLHGLEHPPRLFGHKHKVFYQLECEGKLIPKKQRFQPMWDTQALLCCTAWLRLMESPSELLQDAVPFALTSPLLIYPRWQRPKSITTWQLLGKRSQGSLSNGWFCTKG